NIITIDFHTYFAHLTSSPSYTSLLYLLLILLSILFLFSLPPPPPRSTLFPYTTLFRSSHYHRYQDAQYRWHRSVALCPHHIAGLYRKSTRLNSSHQIISYAVFCLKKKKKKK